MTAMRRIMGKLKLTVNEEKTHLTGWANYFCLGPVSPAYRTIDTHTRQWLRRWLFRKHKIAGTGTSRFPGQYL